jgi:hypothetical protein
MVDFLCLLRHTYGPGISVGIVTDYGLDGPGIESRWGQDFPPVQTGPGAHPASCTMGTGSFPGVECSWGSNSLHASMNVGPCHHGMARPQVADGGTTSNMEGSCE